MNVENLMLKIWCSKIKHWCTFYICNLYNKKTMRNQKHVIITYKVIKGVKPVLIHISYNKELTKTHSPMNWHKT